MTILSEHEIYYLQAILSHLRELKQVVSDMPLALSLGTEALADNIDWLNNFISDQPITRLRNELSDARTDYKRSATELIETKRELLLAKSGIDSLRHLQKYEGMQKIESDNLAYKAIEAQLRAKIAEQAAELEALRR